MDIPWQQTQMQQELSRLTAIASIPGLSVHPSNNPLSPPSISYKDHDIFFACKSGNVPLVHLFLSLGVPPECRDESNGGATPMHWAAYTGQTEVIQLLLSNGANPHPRTLDEEGHTPLMWACMAGHLSTIKLLLEVTLKSNQNDVTRVKEEVDAQDSRGYSTIHHAAMFGNVFALHMLKENGHANMILRDYAGHTAAHWAAYKGHLPALRYLIEDCGINPRAVDDSRRSALHWASRQGHTRVCQYLCGSFDRSQPNGLLTMFTSSSTTSSSSFFAAPLQSISVAFSDASIGSAEPQQESEQSSNSSHDSNTIYSLENGREESDEPVSWQSLSSSSEDTIRWCDPMLADLENHNAIEWAREKGFPQLSDLMHSYAVLQRQQQHYGSALRSWGALVQNAVERTRRRTRHRGEESESDSPSSSSSIPNRIFHQHRQISDSIFDFIQSFAGPTVSTESLHVAALFLFLLPFVFTCAGQLPSILSIPVIILAVFKFSMVIRTRKLDEDPNTLGAPAWWYGSISSVGFLFAFQVVPTLGWFSTVFFFSAYAIMIGLHTYVAKSDPGVVLSSKADRKEILSCANECIVLPQRHCATCLVRRPLRSKHCRAHQHCVGRFDHCCIWLANCIGWKNHRYFLYFLVTHVMIQAFVIIKTVSFLADATWVHGSATFSGGLVSQCVAALQAYPATTLACVLYNFAIATGVVTLLVTQIRQSSQNLTTNEVINAARYDYLVPVSDSHRQVIATAFDRGSPLLNFLEFFFPRGIPQLLEKALQLPIGSTIPPTQDWSTILVLEPSQMQHIMQLKSLQRGSSSHSHSAACSHSHGHHGHDHEHSSPPPSYSEEVEPNSVFFNQPSSSNSSSSNRLAQQLLGTSVD